MRPAVPFFVTALVLALGLFAPVAAAAQEVQAGPVSHEEFETALKYFRPPAERGDALAQYNLGRLYSQGRGAAPNYSEAIAWFRKAAAQGNPDAQARLADMLAKGQGAPRNLAEAQNWYRQAAAQGNSDAAIALAEAIGATAPPTALDRANAMGRMASMTARGPGVSTGVFAQQMNAIFGPGRWRETSGYRSMAEENELRAEGAFTVPAGAISHHSMGTPGAPGAYDIVVAGMSPSEAAQQIRRSGVAFRRLFPESAHGSQGPHLHVEPESMGRGL